jgi:hypothetical protein
MIYGLPPGSALIAAVIGQGGRDLTPEKAERCGR